METVLTTVLSTVLFLSTAATPAMPSTQQDAFTRVLAEKDYVGYIVERDDSLANIAQKAYGSDTYWTTLWNDNAWITDPENVSKDAILKIRIEKPQEAMELESVLAERNNEVLKQKNNEYLQQIGYMPAEQVLPTAVPTQATPIKASNGAISDEAITYLGNCEAGMNPAKNTGNGYYGAFQFSASTWNKLNTGYARADLAPIEVQKAAVQQLLQKSNIYNQFPGCARKMRSAGLI